jgi:hypothetical protein
VETGKSATLLLHYSTFHYSFPHFPDSTCPGPAASPIGWSRTHTANQNGGDLNPYDDETGQLGHMWLILSDFFLHIQAFFIYRNVIFMKKHLKIKR